jgi:hypothetical protein
LTNRGRAVESVAPKPAQPVRASLNGRGMFHWHNLKLRYDPFPIGLVAPVLEADYYHALVDAFPPIELFQYKPEYGEKYSLSEKNNPRKYRAFVRSSPPWRELHAYVKSRDFVFSVFDALRERNVDLGITRRRASRAGRWLKLLRNVALGRMPSTDPPIYSRFEFSALPADGGQLLPHTDARRKLVTVVVSMVRDGEWPVELGGGTEIMRPRDPSLNYNFVNRQLRFEEVETIDAFPFRPNQAVLFVKTFNSLHGMHPMPGRGSPLLRRTLTINIEHDY